jgi:hypothetical protein
MDEEEWLACVHPMPMLEFVVGRVSDRKLRLFACACCRLPAVSRLLRSEQSQAVIRAAEWASDREGSWEHVILSASAAPRGWVSGGPWRSPNPVRLPPSSQAERAVLSLAAEDAWEGAYGVVRQGGNLLGSRPCGLLRDVVGPLPFRAVRIPSAWLAWNDATVPRIAQDIYDERAFYRLPVLADALEDAGCTDRDILGHLRGTGPHVRGCWALDLVLEKT